MVRTSLRKKLAYTFLAGALLTVVLFSLVIKGIITDYFKREGDARQQFVQDQSKLAVRSNLTVFNDRLQQVFAAGTVALNSVCRTGILGDHLDQRESATKLLRSIQTQAKLSLITIVGPNGKVILRATNPFVYGDDVLMGDYDNPSGPVSSIRHLIEDALKGKTVTTYESFAPETLAAENVLENGKVVSSLKDYVEIPVRGRDVPAGTTETRALTLTFAAPVLNSQGRIVGAVLAGRVINRDLGIVQDVRNLLQDEATVFFGQLRITTTLKQGRGDHKGESSIGTLNILQVPSGQYLERQSKGRPNGEELMGVFDPIKDYDGADLGALYIGRPLSYLDEIARAQSDIETAVERRTSAYIVALAIVSMIIAIVIATIFSRRISKQIDQLRKGAETISDGSLDYRLKITSGDEIELLAEQFNSMAAKLQESYQTLENKVEERTRELKQSQDAMVQQEKMVGIGQLAAGIAHELNTPLGTIIGYAQMLREDLAAQPSANGSLHDVDEIVEQAGRCRDLVKNLLNFSRRSTTEKSQADLNAIVRKIVSLVGHDFDMKQVRVRLNLDPNLPKATVNENEIAQVVLNLANNAADSMPDGGQIDVTTTYETTTDQILIEVSDTGIGISESDRTRVFEPFFTTKEVGKGTGLGLSICYKIVENHMGSMEFDSVPGRGTTFRVYVPVHAEVVVGQAASILVVKDDAKHGTMCARLLERKGYEARSLTSGREALALLDQKGGVDVVLADLQMPEMDGIQLLSAVKDRHPHIEFIVMTGYGTVKTAVEAMQLGAAHYIQKPLDHDELNILIERVIEKKHLEEKVDRLRAELQGKYSFDNVIGRSEIMQKVIDKMAAACGNRATVLITGESGTGKELVARGIHYNTFKDDAPFVPVNCGALPKDLIESELFGYKRGSFTGAVSDSEGLFRAADGGTIFLDEVMEMSPELQVKLMRVLQERKIRHLGDTRELPVNVRVIAATNKPLAEALESGAIRKDLYYRLSVITIHLPPLRERAEDVPMLIEHFLRKHQESYGKTITGIEPQALEALMKYPWPGNVRELENMVEMLLAYAKSPVIRVADLPERITEVVTPHRKAGFADDEVFTLKEAERRLIINALNKSKGNKSLAALMLGISRKSLYKKLVDYNIPERGFTVEP